MTFTQAMVDEINRQVDHLCSLRFTEDEVAFIGTPRYMRKAKGFLEFLRMYKLNRKYIHISLGESGKLDLWAEGPVFQVSYFETPVLAIISEVYYRYALNATSYEYDQAVTCGQGRLRNKIHEVVADGYPVPLVEFGTRRRFSRDHQEWVLQTLIEGFNGTECTLIGTSNVMFAMKYGLTLIGTFAHEYVCLGQALEGVQLIKSQKHQFEEWMDEYDGDLGVILGDTLGKDMFFDVDFGRKLSMASEGSRHDSGPEIAYGEKAIQHYRSYNIEPMTKKIAWSNALKFTVNGCVKLLSHFDGRIGGLACIGTDLTNDMGVPAVNIVYKLVEANGKPVAKLSDDAGKGMCEDPEHETYLRAQIAKTLEQAGKY